MDPRTVLAVTIALDQLPELVTRLELDLVRATPDRGSHSGKPGSRPPVDLGIVSDIDETWNAVTTWTRDWCDVLDRSGPRTWTWGGVCGWLAAHWAYAVEHHPAADDFADELLHHHDDDCRGYPPHPVGWVVRLRRHDGAGPDRVWLPLPGRWRCPTVPPEGPGRHREGPNAPGDGESHQWDSVEPVAACGGLLLEHTADRVIVCRSCGASWAGDLGYERLGRLLGCETLVTVRQAAELARVHRATIDRWITAGQLPTVPLPSGDRGVDTRDLALLAARRVGT